MTTDPQILAWLDQEDAHTAQTIRAHGWVVQYVGGGEEPGEPPFGYTITFPWDPEYPCGPECQPRPGTWTA